MTLDISGTLLDKIPDKTDIGKEGSLPGAGKAKATVQSL